MELILNKEKYNVEIKINDNLLKSIINEKNFEFTFRRISENQISLLIDGKYQNVYFAQDDNHIFIAYDGDNFIFDKVKDEDYNFEEINSNNENINKLMPPMPGSVVKILVDKGQKVSEGEGIIIIEAMKMEITLYSSIDGVVTEINVKAGEIKF